MIFGYDFAPLTSDEKLRRRILLDHYATVGQLSVVVVIAVLQLYFLFSWITEKFFRGRTILKSPGPKATLGGTLLNRLSRGWRKLLWLLDTPIWPEWASWGQLILASGWALWLLVLCVAETGHDYFHVTKRAGIVAASQLPLHYLLILRSPYSPLQILTRLSHEQLKVYHQLLGKIIVGFFGLHATLYLYFFVVSGLINKRIKDGDVIIGILGIILFGIINTTALSYVRQWNYRFFYFLHVTLSVTVILLIYFHVRHIRPYVYQVLGIYIIHQVLRGFAARIVPGKLESIEGTTLVRIRLPLSSLNAKGWKPGQHAYLSKPTSTGGTPTAIEAFLQRHRSNPFTILSLPGRDKEIHLVARILGGNTRQLAKLAATRNALESESESEVKPSIPLILEGPYGASPPLSKLIQFDRILIVAGGVGATFALPIYRSLTEPSGEETSASVAAVRTHLVWAVRNVAEAKWALALDQDGGRGVEAPRFKKGIQVYLTSRAGGASGADADEGGGDGDGDGDGEDIELVEREHLLATEEAVEEQLKGIQVEQGRPDLRKVVADACGQATDKIAVLVCGPAGLVHDVRKEVARHIAGGRDVFWHAESFGW